MLVSLRICFLLLVKLKVFVKVANTKANVTLATTHVEYSIICVLFYVIYLNNYEICAVTFNFSTVTQIVCKKIEPEPSSLLLKMSWGLKNKSKVQKEIKSNLC